MNECHQKNISCNLSVFFDKAPSFEVREAHRHLNNRLGIFRDRGGGLLDHLRQFVYV